MENPIGLISVSQEPSIFDNSQIYSNMFLNKTDIDNEINDCVKL